LKRKQGHFALRSMFNTMANLVFQTNNQAYVSHKNHPPECLLLSWNRDFPCDKRSYTADVLQSNDEVLSCVTFFYMFQN